MTGPFPAEPGSEKCTPKLCADIINDEDEGYMCWVHDVDLSSRKMLHR